MLAGDSQRKTQRVVPVEIYSTKISSPASAPNCKSGESVSVISAQTLDARGRPTFFTHDLGFFDPLLCHKDYSLVCLDVNAKDTAVYIRRFLRHPGFRTQKQRLGKVIWRAKET